MAAAIRALSPPSRSLTAGALLSSMILERWRHLAGAIENCGIRGGALEGGLLNWRETVGGYQEKKAKFDNLNWHLFEGQTKSLVQAQ